MQNQGKGFLYVKLIGACDWSKRVAEEQKRANADLHLHLHLLEVVVVVVVDLQFNLPATSQVMTTHTTYFVHTGGQVLQVRLIIRTDIHTFIVYIHTYIHYTHMYVCLSRYVVQPLYRPITAEFKGCICTPYMQSIVTRTITKAYLSTVTIDF